MKYEFEDKKSFNPITLTITLESKSELVSLTRLLGKEMGPYHFFDLYNELREKNEK